MIFPLPPGTRDVLPDEMRELRAISDSLGRSFSAAGYSEVWTPALEYEDVLKTGDSRATGAGFRLFDEEGRVLVLRSDTTIPIARMAASHMLDVEPPIRLSYFAHTYREVVRGAGHAQEFLQGGVELIGVAGPAADAEIVALALRALDEVGLARHRVGLGDGSLYRNLLTEFGVPAADHLPLLELLVRRDLPLLEARIADLGLAADAADLLVQLPRLRGGAEVLDRPAGPANAALENLRACHQLLAEQGLADRVIFDLGLVRELGYYTGAVFEVYDPAVGFALGGGGRYDELLGRFGRPLPACGVALDIHRVHVAQAAEEKIG